MAIQQPEATNLWLAFRVLHHVQQLRRRVTPRVRRGSVCSSQLGTESPLDVRALGNMSTGLSQVSFDGTKQTQRVANGVSKTRRNSPKAIGPQARPLHVPASSNAYGDEVQHMLSVVDDSLATTGSTLSAIAGDDRLFLNQGSLLILECRPLNEAVQLLAAIQHAIKTLSECRSQYGDVWLAAQGCRIGWRIDEKFIANYEHLLLRLRAELVHAIARKALAELVRRGHNKQQQRKVVGWFTEFAEKPRPLSTSFPWTIKPSLAVLWGVCWMFYGEGSDEDEQAGHVRVRQDIVLQQVGFDWGLPCPSDYVNFGLELIATEPQPAVQQQAGHDVREHVDGGALQEPDRNAEPWHSDLDALEFGLPSVAADQVEAIGSSLRPPQFPAYGAVDDAAHGGLGRLLPLQCIYAPDVRQGSSDHHLHLPPDEPPPAFYHSDHQPWQPPHPSLPPRTDSYHPAINTVSTPSITVTGSSENVRFAAPHFASASSLGGIYQLDNPNLLTSPPTIHPTFQPATPTYISMSNTLLPGIPAMQSLPHIYKHERKSSVNSNSDIPTPVSMSDNRSPLASPNLDRTRIVTGPQEDARDGSEEPSSHDGDDAGSPLKNHSYKRAEDPPRNHEGRMICRHPDCTSLTFDRKCEWSKHMDKHDRPYKCNVKGCEKLQGFTYSGGLLRHEREVHKMHGGTKKSLFCPFTDCKRSSGAGFTRKENLAEHIRRVHRRTSMSADLNGLVMRRRQSQGSSPPIETRQTSESPYTHMIDYREDDEISHKRKHVSISGYSDHGDEDLRAEIKRLRQQNEEKDARLKQLEQAVMALQQNRR